MHLLRQREKLNAPTRLSPVAAATYNKDDAADGASSGGLRDSIVDGSREKFAPNAGKTGS